jgi:hypothetical protein
MPMRLYSFTLACNLWLYKVFPWLRWRERITRGNLRSEPSATIYQYLNPEISRGCIVRIFHECQLRLRNGLPRDGK